MKLVQRYYEEMWNAWNFGLADELLTDDFCFRGSFGLEVRGVDAFKDYMRLVQSAFPDFYNKIEHTFSCASQVVARLTYTGTHNGGFLGVAATRRRVTYPGIAIFERKGSRLSKGYVVGDRLLLMEAILGQEFWRGYPLNP
jgi:steroid delta-isomerase-like uncharacterized protein